MSDIQERLKASLSDRYRIERELGRGGMATVFLAKDLKHGRQVAIKVLSPDIARAIGAERFEREIKLAAQLTHPHILALHDSGEADGLLFYVMPYVKGESLRDRLRREVQLPVEEAVRIASQVADALDHAHRHDMVHRDIKPENILLSGGHAIVADFGVARVTGAAESEATITQAGTAVGTPLYMSPEQAGGQAHVDGRSDQYALACVLYEMLTGQPPFTGATAQAILRQHVSASVPAASTVRTSTPKHVETAIARALSKIPADRYASLGEFARAIGTGTGMHSPVETSAATMAVPTPHAHGGPQEHVSSGGDPFAAARRSTGEASAAGASTPGRSTPHTSTPGRAPLAPAGSTPLGTPMSGVTPPDVRRRTLGPALIAIAAIVVFSVLAWIVIQRPASNPAGAAGGGGPMRLVVLPFENLGSADDEYFADGITEEITSRLASLEGLGVIARTSAMQYKESNKSVQEIGRELGVTYILEGTVRWDKGGTGPSRVRVTPQLVRVSDATHVWADRYDAVLAEVFDVQTKIATAVTSALGMTLLNPKEAMAAEKPTENLEAYDAYLRGSAHLENPNDEDRVREAIVQLEKAVELDPGFALAYARLSFAHNVMQWYGHDPGPARLQKAREAVERALKIAPEHPEAHLAMGWYHYWGSRDYESALQEFDLAQRKRPNDPNLFSALGAVYRRQGRWAEAVHAMERAVELDPRAVSNAVEAATTFLVLRDYERAKRYADVALALDPRNQLAGGLAVWLELYLTGDVDDAWRRLEKLADAHGWNRVLAELSPGGTRVLADYLPDRLETPPSRPDEWAAYGELLLAKGQTARARAAFDSSRVGLEAALKQAPDVALLHSGLAYAYARLGKKDLALRHGRLAAERLPVSRDALYGGLVLIILGDVYLITGEREAAIDVIVEYLSVPSFLGPQDIERDPLFAPVIDDPRVQAAMKRASRPYLQPAT